jgi:hypothetical protein
VSSGDLEAFLCENVVWLCLAAIFAQIVFWCALCSSSFDSHETLSKRLKGYAVLKERRPKNCYETKCQFGCAPGQDGRIFEVLLGTLKKVEQKNSVLTAILVVAISLSAS